MEDIQQYCLSPSLSNFEALPSGVRKEMVSLSKKAAKKKGANQKLASLILDHYRVVDKRMGRLVDPSWRRSVLDKTSGYVMDVIPEGTLVFRATKNKEVLVKDRATYVALEISNANQYLPSSRKGSLAVYRTTKELRLFSLDNLENANRLLREAYRLPDKTLYDTIKGLFIGDIAEAYFSRRKELREAIVKRDDPVQLHTLMRSSVIKNDFVFSHWLCSKGYMGYSAGIMKMFIMGNLHDAFPEEIMLCDPTGSLKRVAEIPMKKQTSRSALDDILDSLKN
jgi:hypothetical protein